MEMCEAVMEFTRFNIDEVFYMPAQDFFIYLEYINERNHREWIKQKMELEKQRARMRNHR